MAETMRKKELIKRIENLEKQLDANGSLIFNLQRNLSGLSDRCRASQMTDRYTLREARFKNLEDAVGKLIELKYPENMSEQQKVFFHDTLERFRNKID